MPVKVYDYEGLDIVSPKIKTILSGTLECNRIRLYQSKEFGNFKLMKSIFLSVVSLPLLICTLLFEKSG